MLLQIINILSCVTIRMKVTYEGNHDVNIPRSIFCYTHVLNLNNTHDRSTA